MNTRLKELYQMKGILQAKKDEILAIPTKEVMKLVDELILYAEHLNVKVGGK